MRTIRATGISFSRRAAEPRGRPAPRAAAPRLCEKPNELSAANRLRRRASWLGPVVVFCLGEAPAAAQQAPDTVGLEELVVTVHRLAMPRDAVPASLTVITGEELQSRGVRSVQDALRSVAGVALVQNGSYGGVSSLFLRGGQSDYVRVLVDGVPVNRPGGSYDFAHLTTENIERIEVVRGPGSVLYGSDAVTGVVQVFTRHGQGDPRATAALRAGSHGSLGLDADVGGGNDGVSYTFSVSNFRTDGIYDLHNDYSTTSLSGRVQIRPDEDSDITLSLRHSDNELHYPTNGAGFVVRDATQLQDVTTIGLELGRFLTERLETRLLLAANEMGGALDDQPLDPDEAGAFSYRSQEAVRRRSADARANLHLTPASVVTAGAYFEQQRERSFSESLSEWGTTTGSIELDRWNRAYYVQGLTDLSGQLAANAGVRVEDNEAFGTFTAYRAGAVFRLGTATRLHGTAGTGFKEPTFYENFASGSVRGNPDLVPERSRSWEIGLEQAFLGGRIRLSGTYFDQHFRDLIQYTAQPAEEGDPNFFNVAAATADGFESDAVLSPVPELTIRANYTYLRTRVEDAGFDTGAGAAFVEGDRLLRRPTHAANLDLAYRLGTTGTMHVRLNHVGEREDQDFTDWPARRVTLPAYTTVAAGGEYTLSRGGSGLPGITATALIENVFDRDYVEVYNFLSRGRTVTVGARLRF